VTPADCERTDGEDGGDDKVAVAPTFARRRSCRPASAQPATCRRLGARGGTRGDPPGDASLPANSEGGQTSDGRRERPTNFGPLDVDCVS
jgi:hypothetical protein